MKRKDVIEGITQYFVSVLEEGYEISIGDNINGLHEMLPGYVTAMFSDDELLICVKTALAEAIDIENKKGKKVLRSRIIGPSGLVTLLLLEETFEQQLEEIKKVHGGLPQNMIVVKNYRRK